MDGAVLSIMRVLHMYRDPLLGAFVLMLMLMLRLSRPTVIIHVLRRPRGLGVYDNRRGLVIVPPLRLDARAHEEREVDDPGILRQQFTTR